MHNQPRLSRYSSYVRYLVDSVSSALSMPESCQRSGNSFHGSMKPFTPCDGEILVENLCHGRRCAKTSTWWSSLLQSQPRQARYSYVRYRDRNLPAAGRSSLAQPPLSRKDNGGPSRCWATPEAAPLFCGFIYHLAQLPAGLSGSFPPAA